MRRAVLLLSFCAIAISSPAQTFSTLYNFKAYYSDGSEPWGSLVQGADNSFYGETYMGGTYGSGTLFKITSKGALTTLHSFNQNDPNEPQAPWGGLAQGGDGNFYGVSASGGLYHAGTVFKITPGGVMTTLYTFCWGQNCVSGWAPSSALALGLDGNFYGTTQGSANPNCYAGCGIVFKMTPSGDISVLHNFNDVDGAGLKSRLLRVGDGSFYGTTVSGGTGFCPGSNDGCGVAFRITPEGTFSTIYTFCKQEYCPDGAIPQAGLIQGSDGNFYGTTTYDPVNGCGTIFQLTPQGALTSLHTFDRTHGCKPMGELLQGPDGNFYGTTSYGGTADYGTVFRMSPSGLFTVLHEFCAQKPCSDDSWPNGGLTLGNDGLIYGATFDGGINGIGTIFTLDAGFKPLSVTKTGSGTVTSADGRINCGNICWAAYQIGDKISLTATPDQGWTFGSWNGCDNAQNNVCTVMMNNARTVSATFDKAPVLTGLVVGSGVINSNDGKFNNCSNTCSSTYLPGSVVTLTPTAAQGWAFIGWTGCNTVRGDMCWVTMNADHTVTATFVPTYAVTVSPAAHGTISGGEGHIYCGSACSYSYPKGEQLEFTAVPAAGYTFSGWTGCDKVQSAYCFVTLNSARNITAAFSSSSVTLKSLVLNPSTVKGGQLSAATLTLNAPAPEGGLGVSIASNIPNAAHPPAWIVVPAGRTTTGFAVRTFPVKKNTTVNISASTGTSQVSAPLTITTGYGSQQSDGPTRGKAADSSQTVEASGFSPTK